MALDVVRLMMAMSLPGLGSMSLGAVPAFTDVTGPAGLTGYTMDAAMTGGVAAADYDGDGDIDLFAPTAAGVPHRLYRNQGDGTFEEIAAAAGLALTERARAALWVDYDNDGDLDLFIGGDQWTGPSSSGTTLRLFRHDPGGAFVDVTVESNLSRSYTNGQIGVHLSGLASADADGDGDLDLYLCHWQGLPYLLANDGDGTFTDVTLSSGINSFGQAHWQPVLVDLTGDGLVELAQAIDFSRNLLWINQGGLQFVERGMTAQFANAMNDMGIAVGDYDNDADLDFYITNIYVDSKHNVLMRNNSTPGGLLFEEVSQAAGVADGKWGWGTTFADFDNDGLLDIAATNGFTNGEFVNDASRLFMNQGGSPPIFVDAAATAGFADTDYGGGLIALDFDRDGDMDTLQACALGGPLRLLRNDTPVPVKGNWLMIRPRQHGANRFAIGAQVTVTAGGRTRVHPITAGISSLGQEPAEAHFGLGLAAVAEEVRVRWPDGTERVLTHVGANQLLTITPTCPGDGNGDAMVDLLDLNLVLGNFGAAGLAPVPGDVNSDRAVDFGDLNQVLGNFGSSCE